MQPDVTPEVPADVADARGAVDELIRLVRGLPTHGGGHGDLAGQVMVGAYMKCFTRLVSVRQIAARGAGEDAFILVRSMLSALARAVWVNEPSAIEERRARFMC